jgi:broad specificity phosphatase PhoE
MTRLYLVRHGATNANLARPPRLQGRHQNPPLAPLGIRQAELTRLLLAIQPIDACYTSPLLRAFQTATILAAPHDITPIIIDDLTECDVGEWEGLDWETIQKRDGERYRRYMSNPARFGYPGGESFAQVHERSARVFDSIWEKHAGQSVLVVSHHVVNRTYLAELLGLKVERAREVELANCGVSIIDRIGHRLKVTTLNASFHLQGAAA